MTMTRRQFTKSLGAGIVLLPFLNSPLRAATTAAPRRLIIITSLGTNNTLWTPKSAPGQALQLQTMTQPLSTVADNILMVDGLSMVNPTEGHTTPQTLTGKTFDNAYGPSTMSVDAYIAAKLGAQTKLPSLLLGWQAKNESQFWANGTRVPPNDSPINAWQTAFGGSATTAPTTSSGTKLPRTSILNLVTSQIKSLQNTLGSAAKQRLDNHLTSISELEQNLSAPLSGSCTPPAQPTLSGDPEADTNTDAVAQAHQSLAVAALSCDVTRIIGMQWGVSNQQYLGVPNVMGDEHSFVHSGSGFYPQLMAAEEYLCTWFANLVTALKKTPDPLASGSSLLDNTLVMWTRDISDGPDHKQYSMPYILAGATGYLKTQMGGNYFTYGGSDPSNTTGRPHQRLLLNLCDWMGVSDYTNFGTVSTLGAGDQQPLTDLKV